jgi:hypothetical protein
MNELADCIADAVGTIPDAVWQLALDTPRPTPGETRTDVAREADLPGR